MSAALALHNAALPRRFATDPVRPLPAAVFDVDGTLVRVDELAAEHLDRPGRKDWDSFHRLAEFALANQPVVDEARRLYAAGVPVLAVTARMDRYAGTTARWLAAHGVAHDRLYMRRDRDFRPDVVIKAEIVLQIAADGFEVAAAWDDNPDIIGLWRRLGARTTAVRSRKHETRMVALGLLPPDPQEGP